MDDAIVEAIARDYCRRIGADPDEVIGTAHPQHSTLTRHIPRWEFHADAVRAAVSMRDAIDSVRLAVPGTADTDTWSPPLVPEEWVDSIIRAPKLSALD